MAGGPVVQGKLATVGTGGTVVVAGIEHTVAGAMFGGGGGVGGAGFFLRLFFPDVAGSAEACETVGGEEPEA
jgi:hypothetical protein